MMVWTARFNSSRLASAVLFLQILWTLIRFYGHRNDPKGYANALEEFDRRLPEIIAALSDDDILMLTADHGNDPTTSSTDHSRERVPLLIAGKRIKGGANIGTRKLLPTLRRRLPR